MMVCKILGKDSHHFIDVLHAHFASARRVQNYRQANTRVLLNQLNIRNLESEDNLVKYRSLQRL